MYSSNRECGGLGLLLSPLVATIAPGQPCAQGGVRQPGRHEGRAARAALQSRWAHESPHAHAHARPAWNRGTSGVAWHGVGSFVQAQGLTGQRLERAPVLPCPPLAPTTLRSRPFAHPTDRQLRDLPVAVAEAMARAQAPLDSNAGARPTSSASTPPRGETWGAMGWLLSGS